MAWRRNYMFFIFGILLTTSLPGYLCNICEDAIKDEHFDIRSHLHKNVKPVGEMDTGRFEEDKNAKDHAECLTSCCEKKLCNLAWFTQGKCYTIECMGAEVCKAPSKGDAQTASSPSPKDTLLIEVRTFEETESTNECQLLQDDCDDNMHCIVRDDYVTRCECIDGYVRAAKQLRKCVKKPEVNVHPQPDDSHRDIGSQTCEFGLLQCGPNAECVPKPDSKSMVGTCQCNDGFVFDSGGGTCVKTKKDTTVSQTCELGLLQCGPNAECVPKPDSKSMVGTYRCNDGFVFDSGGGTYVETKTDTTTTSVSAVPSTKLSTLFPPTTSKPVTTTPKVEILTVSAGDNKVLQLPEESEITLKAFVIEDQEDTYHYEWSLELHPENSESGTMEGQNTDTLKLSNLIAGLYTFKVKVTGTNKFGEATVNVTVNPPARKNTPPVAIIKPKNLQVKLPNTAILDGSDSTDDDKIVSYHWEEVNGPLRDQKISDDTAILTLQNLAPGNYTFKLTVTDSDGSVNSTTANVTAIKETDYPPKANAGSDVVIHLPQNSVVLNGNLSTDDKGIVSYEWIKLTDDNLAADIQGTRTSELHLSHLEVGDYIFTLKVTDLAGQSSTADVHVYVKPEQNTPPVAITAKSIEASLPLDSILLDGSNSTDDQGITSYLWQQTGGPTILSITDADKSIATASGEIKVGRYQFQLTVKDVEELKSTSTLVIDVRKVENEPPLANAGGNQEIQLPQLLVTLDGSKSTDDHKITDYHWVRDPKSLAAGDILNNSDHQAVLQLVNLVAGQYIFSLTVKDSEGLSNKDTASLVVKGDNHAIDKLELLLDADIKSFTSENKLNLEGQLALLLPKSSREGETVVHVENIQKDDSTSNLRVQFYAMTVNGDKKMYRPGLQVYESLKRKLMSQPYMLDFKVVRIDTLVCQNNCSNHGHCDQKTKQCICEAFWMQNLLNYNMYGDTNCDWSILYVVIVCFLIVIAIVSSIWACVCFWKRRRCRCRVRSKRRHRYSLLEDMDDIDKDKIEMKKGKIQNSSVMISESDFSSEEETIFMNPKKSNGYVPKNGLSKREHKTKLKT